MLSPAARKTALFSETSEFTHRKGSLISRKIWLPGAIYRVLPAFYVGSGIAAFLATLYISEWFWILPHYTLFSVACVHLGLFVYRRRHRRHSDQA